VEVEADGVEVREMGGTGGVMAVAAI